MPLSSVHVLVSSTGPLFNVPGTVSPNSRTTPARLIASATEKLPRWALIGLSLAYILAGLFFRSPWKTDDAVGLATMITAVRQGGSTWLLPQVGALAHAEDGPMVTWVGGALVHVFGPWIGDISAGRLPDLLWFGMTAFCVWYGTYLLGRRPEAQPLALPFGGEPTVHDYGRMLADAAVLLLMATVGIVQLVHQTSPTPAILAFEALTFLSLARMIDRPVLGSTLLGVALAACVLTRGWPAGVPICLSASLALLPNRGSLRHHRRWLIWAAVLATLLLLAWWIPALHTSSYWTRNWKTWNANQFAWPSWDNTTSTLQDIPWFVWPTWPFALLTIWRWRNWLLAPHVWLPMTMLVCPLVTLFFLDNASDPDLIVLVVPSAVLATFSLPTLRRAVINTLDWFAIMCFSLASATVWLGWVALNFGWPPRIAHNIGRLTTGYNSTVYWPAVLLALVVTVLWALVVYWRLEKKPLALWRGTVLSASGLAATWLLLVLLWQPAVDYARNYQSTSAALAQAIAQNQQPGECLRAQGLGSGQRAVFLIFNNLNFSYDQRCTLVLQQTSRESLKDRTSAYMQGAEVLWQGGRLADRHEVFRLLRVPARH